MGSSRKKSAAGTPLLRSAVLTALLALASSGASATHSESGSYLVPGPPAAGVVCSPDCAGVAGADLGGFTFAPNGAAALRVLVDDVTGGPVAFWVTQDLDGDGISGNDDETVGPFEPRVQACGSVAELAPSVVAFDPSVALDVSVAAVDPLTCEAGRAIGGTITVEYR